MVGRKSQFGSSTEQCEIIVVLDFQQHGIAHEPIQNNATITNIQSAFRTTGICPLNENIFTDVDFLSSEITNRPPNDISRPITPVLMDAEEEMEMQTAMDIGANVEVASDALDLDRTLEEVQPFPQAGPLKATGRGRNAVKRQF